MATPDLNPSNVVVDLEKGMGGRRDTAAVAPPKKIILPNKMTTTTTTTTTNNTTEQRSDDASSINGLIGMSLIGLYLYYIFFVFYMVGTCEKWWHAALAIGIATAFLVLSFCLAAMQSKPSSSSSSRKIQPQDTTQTDLGRRLLASSHQ